ncbi:MAG: ABC transporter permease [Coriobacteriales bacterium]|nr:ABC transporter permease [Coriobacteriales bacterium]
MGRGGAVLSFWGLTRKSSQAVATVTGDFPVGHCDDTTFLPNDFEPVSTPPQDTVAEDVNAHSYWREILINFCKKKSGVVSLFGIVVLVLLALFGPVLSGYTYDAQLKGQENMAPRVPVLENIGIFDGSEVIHASTKEIVSNKYQALEGGAQVYHLFGTDSLGRDLFTRVCEGTRISLFIALMAVFLDIVVGLTFGLISGYFGGWLDNIMQRFIEIIYSIPDLVIITLFIVIFKPGLLSIILALMFTGWVGMSKLARAQVIKLKEQEFVLAARTLGARDFYLIFKEILPSIFGEVLVMSLFSVPSAIFFEAFLSYIGIGIPMPLASLGSLISDAYSSLLTHPYMVVYPATVMVLLMLFFNLFADGLRDAIDPQTRDR